VSDFIHVVNIKSCNLLAFTALLLSVEYYILYYAKLKGFILRRAGWGLCEIWY